MIPSIADMKKQKQQQKQNTFEYDLLFSSVDNAKQISLKSTETARCRDELHNFSTQQPQNEFYFFKIATQSAVLPFY